MGRKLTTTAWKRKQVNLREHLYNHDLLSKLYFIAQLLDQENNQSHKSGNTPTNQHKDVSLISQSDECKIFLNFAPFCLCQQSILQEYGVFAHPRSALFKVLVCFKAVSEFKHWRSKSCQQQKFKSCIFL